MALERFFDSGGAASQFGISFEGSPNQISLLLLGCTFNGPGLYSYLDQNIPFFGLLIVLADLFRSMAPHC
jgi:hypothetical protein